MKKVLITGAGRGIGLATARVFAAAGWRVLSVDKAFGPDIVGERVRPYVGERAAIIFDSTIRGASTASRSAG